MSADSLVAQLRAQRLHWCDLADGIAVQLDTPSQFAAMALMQNLRSGDGDASIGAVCALARDWRGITQAFLLGDGVGSTDPAPFDPRLLQAVLQDRPEWLSELAMAALEQAKKARDRVQGIAGN